MKKLTLILLFVSQSITVAADSSQDETIPGASIEVNCQCSYFNQDGIEKIILTSGESHSVTWDDINGCLLEDGKVINQGDKTSCWKAKMNANWNCSQSAHNTQPGRMRAPAVMLHQNSCHGMIILNDQRIFDNSKE